jgi:hypothetical protein
VRHLKHAGVGTVGADHLEAEWHAGMVDAAGNGGGAAQRHRWGVGDGEPAHVGRHALAVDLLDVELRMGEGRYRCGRADQHVHLRKEGEHALVEPGLLHVRTRHVGERKPQPALGIVDDVAPEQVARRLKPLAVRRDVVHPAQHLEGIVHAAEIRRPLLRRAEDMAEAADALLEESGDAVVDGSTAEVDGKGGAQRAEVGAGQLGGEALGIARGERVALVEAHLRA